MSKQLNTGIYIPGYYIPNIRKLADVIISVLGISAPVSIMPLRIKTSDCIAYTEKQDNKYNSKQGNRYTIFVDTVFLKKDETTDPVINLFIHELWHVKQMEDHRLISDSEYTFAIWEGIHHPMTVIPHEQRPWEIEAYRMEDVYLEKVKEQIAVSIK